MVSMVPAIVPEHVTHPRQLAAAGPASRDSVPGARAWRTWSV